MNDTQRVTVNCRMPCNQGRIRNVRKEGERPGQEGTVPCPERRCPYNKFGDRFDNWYVSETQPNEKHAADDLKKFPLVEPYRKD